MLSKKNKINDNIKLKIVGVDPDNIAEKYRNIQNLEITGYVKSIATEIAVAKLAVAPIFAATGIQNKILEALSCNIDVIACSKVIAPFNDQVKKLIHEANTEKEYIEKILKIMTNKKNNNNYSEIIKNNYSWRKGAYDIHEKIIINF